MNYRRRGRGFGDYPGQQCYDAARPSWLPYWIPDAAETKCVLTTDAAQVYQSVEYGTVPTLPAPPVANVPTGALTDPTGVSVDSTFNTASDWQAWINSIDANIDSAIAGGYTPGGSGLLPQAQGLSDFLSQYGTVLLVGGIVLVGAAILKGRK